MIASSNPTDKDIRSRNVFTSATEFDRVCLKESDIQNITQLIAEKHPSYFGLRKDFLTRFRRGEINEDGNRSNVPGYLQQLRDLIEEYDERKCRIFFWEIVGQLDTAVEPKARREL